MAKKRSKALSKEHLLQCAFVEWFHLAYPNIIIFAVPNGARRSPRLGAYLKAEGMLAGVADLCILKPSQDYCCLFIEFKIAPNKPSQAQLDFISYANENGYAAIICYDLDDAMNITKQYLE